MKYSEFELNIIKKYYPVGGCKECQKYISRSNDSIRHMAKNMEVYRETDWRETKIKLIEYFNLENIYHVYILGLMWGDGTISFSKGKVGKNCYSGPRYSISVSLVEEDAQCVEFIFKNWKINGIFNPGAIRDKNGKIVLFIRVAERFTSKNKEDRINYSENDLKSYKAHINHKRNHKIS
jgi:hypothetical protein